MILYIQPSQGAPMYWREIEPHMPGYSNDEAARLRAGEVITKWGQRIVCADVLAVRAFEENAK